MTDTNTGWTPGSTGTPPPPPPPPVQPSRPLVRSLTDRRFAGVCGGLGAHFGIPPVLLRIAFVLLTVTGGLGLLLYILAVVLIPEEGDTSRGVPYAGGAGWAVRSPADHHTARIVVAAVLLIAALGILGDSVGFGHGGLVWGLGLVALGVYLLVYERGHALPVAATPVAQPSYGSGAFASSGGGPAPATYATPASTWMPTAWPRRRPVLLFGTVALVLLTIGIVTLLDTAGVASLGVGAGFAIALIVIGCGLLAGAWFGRSRALILVGLLLLPIAAVTSVVDVPLTGGTGDIVNTPQSMTDLHSEYHVAAGQLTLDLSQLTLTDDRSVTATLGFGHLRVIVPPQDNVTVTAHDGFGQTDLFGSPNAGVNIDSTATQPGTAGSPTLHLTVRVGFGKVDVTQAQSGTPGGQ